MRQKSQKEPHPIVLIFFSGFSVKGSARRRASELQRTRFRSASLPRRDTTPRHTAKWRDLARFIERKIVSAQSQIVWESAAWESGHLEVEGGGKSKILISVPFFQNILLGRKVHFKTTIRRRNVIYPATTPASRLEMKVRKTDVRRTSPYYTTVVGNTLWVWTASDTSAKNIVDLVSIKKMSSRMMAFTSHGVNIIRGTGLRELIESRHFFGLDNGFDSRSWSPEN